MRRSSIVLAATVAGTAGVLGFHAQSPAVQPATTTTTATTSAPTSSGTSSGSATSSGSSGGSASTGVSGTATGEAIGTQYGNVQVEVTVKDGKITAVQALQLTGNDPRSAQISASAEPV